MKPKIFYRVANPTTQQGLWYDFKGRFTGLIHDQFSFCKNNALQMPFDSEIVGWLSATETLEELFNWFTPQDIIQLEEHGYYIAQYVAVEFKKHNNHCLIKQNTSVFIKIIEMNVESLLTGMLLDDMLLDE